LVIDADRCTGHGRCYTLVPTLFEPDEQGHSAALVDVLTDEQLDLARSAVANCPEQATSIAPE
jgi:ferredoxin